MKQIEAQQFAPLLVVDSYHLFQVLWLVVYFVLFLLPSRIFQGADCLWSQTLLEHPRREILVWTLKQATYKWKKNTQSGIKEKAKASLH